MKGFFRMMKGKKGGALVAVMAAMAVLSIVALCAAGIALTNYRTTQTYVSQDSYYYSAETGQSQFVANLNDVAYNFSSAVENWTEDKVNELYNTVGSVTFDLSDTLYNGVYKVDNVIQGYVKNDKGDATFTIITTVTNTEDNTTQEYTSTITIENPLGESKKEGEDYINVTMDVSDPLMNNGYGVVTGGSYKNTTWYGLWGNFNTYQTNKATTIKTLKANGKSETNPYYDTTNTSPLKSVTNAAKFFSTEKKPSSNSDFMNSGIWLKKVQNEAQGERPDSYAHTTMFSSSSTTQGGSQDKLDNFFDNNIDVDVKGIVQAAGKNNALIQATGNAIQLKYAKASTTEKFYAKYDGDKEFFITFDTKPKDTNLITLADWKTKTGIDKFEPFYRVTANSSKNAHGLAYQYVDSNGNLKTENTTYAMTYDDHYYKNKWFFIDLEKKDGSLGTLHISNSTSAEKFYDYELKNFYWIFYYKTYNYKVKDGYGISNYATFGNIVMEDCYFFVNGNVEIANGFNMSGCKVLATGYIKLESVYYFEGLLSLETKAGSDAIKQTLYYTDSYFQSDLVSRYAMAWMLCTTSAGVSTWQLLSPSGQDIGGNGWTFPQEYKDCAISNGASYSMSGVGAFFVPWETNGYLATYRYPTVLKAIIIAEGKTNFATKTRDDNSRTTSNKTFNDVSVILNPDGDASGVVDCILIEGQIFARYHTYTGNYNYDSANGTNRYASASQIQYHPFGDGSADDVFGELNEIVKNEITVTEYKPIVIINGGITKK